MHLFLQEKTELSSQCISCQAVEMTNVHITATSLLLSCLSTKSICQKLSFKLKYKKENSRNHCERGFPAGERKTKKINQTKNKIISPPNINMDNCNTWNKEKVIPKPNVSGQ